MTVTVRVDVDASSTSIAGLISSIAELHGTSVAVVGWDKEADTVRLEVSSVAADSREALLASVASLGVQHLTRDLASRSEIVVAWNGDESLDRTETVR